MRFLLGGILRQNRGFQHIERGPLENTEVFLIEEGTIFMEADGVRTPVVQGAVLIHPPGTVQRGYRSSPGPVKHLWFHCDLSIKSLDDSALTEKTRECLLKPRQLYGVGAPETHWLVVPGVFMPHKWGVLLHLAYLICENRPCFVYEKSALAAAFFSLLSAEYLLSGQPETGGPASSLVSQVKDYIDQHIDNVLLVRQLGVDQIAAHFDLHPDYLNRLFKKESGMSVHAYVLERRMVLACRFLSYGRSIAEVARHAGFGNPAYFTQAFRRAMRCTPTEYRRSLQSL